MSKLDIINAEITRRTEANKSFVQAEEDLKATLEQFNKLDEFYRDQEKTSRELLECIYKENRHFTGEWPIVYQFAEVETRPYFREADADCNPYFPLSKVQDGTFDGISPLFAPPTRTGAYQRQRSFAATEDVPREPALTALQAFPDISNEPLPAGWPGPQTTTSYCTGEDNPPQLDQVSCEADNGTWVTEPVDDPVWNGPDTAPALLRVPLQAWRDDMVAIRDDVCDDQDEVDYWQDLIDDCDTVLAAIQDDAVFVRATGDPDPAAWGQTQDFTPGSNEDLARDRLITAADTGVPTHVSARSSKLDTDANNEENAFFELIKLRLHQANGSYSKLQATKGQQDQTASLIADNNSAIAALNLMKVKNS